MSNEKQPKQETLTVFLDNIGRIIIGKPHKDSGKTLSVQNPALVHITPNPQTNQLSLQILPLFFREFQADKNAPTIWHYNKESIVLADESTVLSFQLAAQYDQLFSPITNNSASTSKNQENAAPVVKLFDDETK